MASRIHVAPRATTADNIRGNGKLEQCAVVVHPGTQHSLQVAAGLARHGLLKLHLTGAYQGSGWLGRLMGGGISRRHRLLPRELVQTRSREELAATLFSKCTSNASAVDRVWLWRNRRFGRWAGGIAAREARVVHCFDTAAAEIFQVAKRAGVKTVLHMCTPTTRFFQHILKQEAESHPEMADTFPNRWYDDEELARRDAEYELADRVVALSGFVRRTLTDDGVPDHKIAVIPLGVDLDKWGASATAERGSSGTFRAVFVGALTQWKGLSYLLDAWKLLRLPKAELLLIGAQIGRGRWFRAYEHLSIRRLGRLSQDKVAACFARCDAFVFPTLADGFGMVVPQAMCAGLPVIATANCCAPDLMDDAVHGRIVPCRDVEALAVAIEELYRNRKLCRQMGSAARERIRRFTWDRFHRAVADLTRSVLGTATTCSERKCS